MDAHVDRAVVGGERIERPFQVVLQSGGDKTGANEPSAIAGGGRIGRVGFDQKRGPVAAHKDRD